MSSRFSVRNNLQMFSQQNDCAITTRMRLWQVFYHNYIQSHKHQGLQYNLVEEILAYFGVPYQMNDSAFDHTNNKQLLREYLTQKCKWYQVYDFVEYYLKRADDQTFVTKEFNKILEDEQTGYHIINGLVVNITNPQEIETIEHSLQCCPAHVTQHMHKALMLYSLKPNPDYNNAIKESITAVEALCCTIVSQNGIAGVETLGNALNHLSKCGITLHDSLKDAIKALYKYTCNEDGKRHGGATFVHSPVEDARFMIITCSAILNFLMVKWNSTQFLYTTT